MRALKLLACLAIVATVAIPLVAHHAAAGIVDDEVYDMIDDLVDGTPHSEFVLPTTTMGDLTQTIYGTRTVQTVENWIDDGLLTYAAMLDGDVEVLITLDAGSRIELQIDQINPGN